jgi:hypothetical protein
LGWREYWHVLGSAHAHVIGRLKLIQYKKILKLDQSFKKFFICILPRFDLLSLQVSFVILLFSGQFTNEVCGLLTNHN